MHSDLVSMGQMLRDWCFWVSPSLYRPKFAGRPNGFVHSDRSIPITHLPHLAAIGGSVVTRTTSRFAFQKNGRAMLTQDMVGEIQKAFLEVFPDSGAPVQKSGKL